MISRASRPGRKAIRSFAALRTTGLALLLVCLVTPALAVEPSEMLPDPALEARAREIGRTLRCVVCQNQAIDDSASEVARDMRRAVRERLAAGDSDEAVFAFMAPAMTRRIPSSANALSTNARDTSVA